MKKYLSHISAAADWNIPYIENVHDSVVDRTSKLDFTVSQQSARYTRKGKTIHLCELKLPTGAIVLRNGRKVASPELVFLQLARELDIHRLILLGLQLCSHPPGIPSKAITTKLKLKIFLEKTQGHYGHRKALRALKYIENGSASIMESIAYMILTLPNALGGYGLSGVVFNHEIKFKDKADKSMGQKRCFADLYYKSARVAVEYDSFTFHNSPLKQGKDAMRSAILERQAVEVMHMSTIQLYDKDACSDFAYNLASRLGKRIQIRTNKFNP
ncbi:MAG: hypothetical protein WC996_04640, partial [Peptostreptococcales bacterium]